MLAEQMTGKALPRIQRGTLEEPDLPETAWVQFGVGPCNFPAST